VTSWTFRQIFEEQEGPRRDAMVELFCEMGGISQEMAHAGWIHSQEYTFYEFVTDVATHGSFYGGLYETQVERLRLLSREANSWCVHREDVMLISLDEWLPIYHEARSHLWHLCRALDKGNTLSWVIENTKGGISVDALLLSLWEKETNPFVLLKLNHFSKLRGPKFIDCEEQICASCCSKIRAASVCPRWEDFFPAIQRRVYFASP